MKTLLISILFVAQFAFADAIARKGSLTFDGYTESLTIRSAGADVILDVTRQNYLGIGRGTSTESHTYEIRRNLLRNKLAERSLWRENFNDPQIHSFLAAIDSAGRYDYSGGVTSGPRPIFERAVKILRNNGVER